MFQMKIALDMLLNSDYLVHKNLILISKKVNYCIFLCICDQVWENRCKSSILYFEKYLFEIFNSLSFSCGTILSRQMYYIN